MPHISIIIPNYNHSQFLIQRIDSILQQTYKDFELIILDDCSTDNSRDVIELYRGNTSISHIIYNKTNSGSTFKQWNKGISLARGEYIWLAESDDVADIHFLETLVPMLNEGVGIAYCQSNKMNSKNEITGSWLDLTNNFKDQFLADFRMNGIQYIENYLIYLNTIPNASAVIFAKKYYTTVGGADENIKYCSDWLTWLKILLISDVVYIAKPLNNFRFHDGSVIASAMKNSKSNKYYESFDRLMRINLRKYIQHLSGKNSLFNNLVKKNNTIIIETIGREGVFEITNGKPVKGIMKVLTSIIRVFTFSYTISLIKLFKHYHKYVY